MPPQIPAHLAHLAPEEIIRRAKAVRIARERVRRDAEAAEKKRAQEEELARRRAEHEILEQYRDDPERFAEEVLGVRLWKKQRELLRAVVKNRRTTRDRPLFDGDDPLLAHMKWNINRRCDGCGAPYSIVRASTYALTSDLKPDMLRALYHRHGGPPPTVDLVQGKAVHMGTQAACASCEREFYRALAAGPSWVFVDLLVPPPALRNGALSISVPRIVATA